MKVQEEIDALPGTVDTFLVCGVETHICIYQTVVGLLQAGYKVWVVADAVSSRSKVNDQLGQQRMRELGAVLALMVLCAATLWLTLDLGNANLSIPFQYQGDA